MDSQTVKEIVDTVGMVRSKPIGTPDGGFVIAAPAGWNMHKTAPLEPPLPRIVQSVTLHDSDSFVAYVERYKSEATRLFAEPGFLANKAAHITAVFDYHQPATPDRCAHVARYQPRYSDQWKVWEAVDGKQMRQAEFAEFIEENRADIREPLAAPLLDIVRTFKASKKVEYDSVVYQPNGDVMLSYDERTNQQGKSGLLPEIMKLGIPVYFRGYPYAVPIFVRYRVGNGGVAFQLKRDRPDLVEDDAFNGLVKVIEEKTGIEVYLGHRG